MNTVTTVGINSKKEREQKRIQGINENNERVTIISTNKKKKKKKFRRLIDRRNAESNLQTETPRTMRAGTQDPSNVVQERVTSQLVRQQRVVLYSKTDFTGGISHRGNIRTLSRFEAN